MPTTWYGELSDPLADKMQHIRLLVCDVDGVFSDGRIYLGNDGEELKAFHTKDGFGIKALLTSGVDVAIITGRESAIVSNRMRALGVRHIIQGCETKYLALTELIKELDINITQVAYIGDDMPDLDCIRAVGLGVAVSDAHPAVCAEADFITSIRGGFGAVRELTDLIMQCQGSLDSAKESSI